MESLGMSPGALPSGVWFSSWYVVSIDTGHIAQNPQSSPRWSPDFKMKPVLSVSSFNTIRLQPWFILRRVSLLYIVAYTNGCHKEYKGDWLHRGWLHFFWRWEILVWNLVFISPGGQFGHRYLIPMATRHIVQSSLKVQDGVSFFKMESVRPAPFLPHYFSDWSF